MFAIRLRPELFRTFTSAVPVVQHGTYRVRNQSSLARTPDSIALNPRWLTDVTTRVGKCIQFGISPTQTAEAAAILKEIAVDWRELIAGSEGFLTKKEGRTLYRQEIAWGDMVAHQLTVLQCCC